MRRKYIYYVAIFFASFMFVGCGNNKNHIIFKDNNQNIIDEYYVNEETLIKDYDLSYQTKTHNYIFDGWELKESDGDTYIYVPKYIVEERVYCITFNSNGGDLVSGKDIQYLKYGETPDVPVFYKDMCEFVGYKEDICEVTSDYTYTAEYVELTIKNITPMEFIDKIEGGYNFVNFYNDYDLLDGKLDHIFIRLKETGFNIIGLPINWIKYCDENYVIKEEALEKVRKVVDKALEYDLYVVITSYDSYQDMWSSLNYYQYDKTVEIINEMWGQIGEYFKSYDERVIFSCFNEPRDYITNSYTREGAMILNLLNQQFVDLIRSQGYNNKYRLLLITPIWGDSSTQNLKYFKIPDDNYLIVSLHSYSPFGFVHEESLDEISWDENAKNYQIELVNIFKRIKKTFLDNNIAVLMTEYGSRDKNNIIQRSKWLDFYLSVSYSCGIKCMTWDSAIAHYENDYAFSVLNKETGTWKYPEFEEVYKKIYLDKNILPYFEEITNSTQMISEEVKIPKVVTNMITKEKYDIEVKYDKNLFDVIDGKLYAKETGLYYFSFEVMGYEYYYSINILTDYLLYDCSFELEVKENDDKQLQCYIITKNKDVMRVKYDWYSSDESILSINKYSSIFIHNDGVVGIIAVHKETKETGVIELVIKNGKIIETKNVFSEENIS